MDLEEIVKILVNKTGKKRLEIMSLIEKKQIDAGKAISDKAAAILVSQDFEISLKNPSSTTEDAKISDLLRLSPGSSNIIIYGLIERIYHPIEFKKDQAINYVQNIILVDETGNIRLVLWGKMVQLSAKLNLKKGEKVRFMKGTLKHGRMGEREIHFSDNATIEKKLRDVSTKHLDQIDLWKKVLLPSLITKKHIENREVDVQGIVVRELKKNQIKKGKPMNLYMTDLSPSESSPIINIVVWDNRIEDFLKINKGNEILLEGVNLKEGIHGNVEIVVNRRSNLTILSKNPLKLPPSLVNKTNDIFKLNQSDNKITPNLAQLQYSSNLTLNLRILWLSKLYLFTRQDGSEGNVIRLGVFDQFGSQVLVLWDENAKFASTLKIGVIITISEAYLRENRGNFELQLGKNGNISINSQEKFVSLPATLPIIPISKVTESWKFVTLSGEISTISELKSFQKKDGNKGIFRSLNLLDHTDEIRIVAWDKETQLLNDISIGQKIILENLTVRKKSNDELNINFSYNSKINLNIDKSKFPDLFKEIKVILPQYEVNNSNDVFNRISLDQLTQEFKEQIISQQEGNQIEFDEFLIPKIEFRAAIVNIDDRQLYYHGCPFCSKKVELTTEKEGMCINHDNVIPTPKFLLRVTFDDGSKLLTATLLGLVAEKATGMKSYHVEKFLENNNDELLLNEIRKRILGNEFVINGKLGVRSNTENPDRSYWDLKINHISQPNLNYEIKLLESVEI